MPKTKQTESERYARTFQKAVKKGLLRQNGFDYERTVKAQKSPYHKPAMAHRTMFGDKKK